MNYKKKKYKNNQGKLNNSISGFIRKQRSLPLKAQEIIESKLSDLYIRE